MTETKLGASRVAYLGPEGTFSYFTGAEYAHDCLNMPEAVLCPCADLPAVFEAVMGGQAELGVVPLENSLRGTVGQSFDLFLRHSIAIQGEVFARISNALVSRENGMSALRVVYSHAQPLAQCAGWLRKHLPDVAVVPVESTATAARRAADEQCAAAIGHWRLASLLGLGVLASGIEDEPDNWTRFVLVARPETAWPLEKAQGTIAGAARSSLLFTLPDKPGALAGVLNTLAAYDINMRKLESRPLSGECWKYAFFVDVECDLREARYTFALGDLTKACTMLRLLGSYGAGQHLGIGSVQGAEHE